MRRASRRALLGGGSAAAVATAFEAASLGGTFDHRRDATSSGPSSACGVRGADAVLHVGHSTHVIELDGRRVLTDPWFSDPAFGALAHDVPAACSPESLANLDAILLSHEHPDHADLAALDRFPSKATLPVLVPTAALKSRLRTLGFLRVEQLASWEAFALGSLSVSAVPAVHDVPEVGFVVLGSRARVYFAGDTALHAELAAIGERYRPTFALLPVDGTRLRGSSAPTMNAREAMFAARTLGVTAVMPSHAEARFVDPLARWVFTATAADAGVSAFARHMADGLPAVACHTPTTGQRLML